MIIKIINQERNAMYDLTYNNIFIGGHNNNVICGGDLSGNVVKLGEYSTEEKAKEVFDDIIEETLQKPGYGVDYIVLKMPIEEDEGEDE